VRCVIVDIKCFLVVSGVVKHWSDMTDFMCSAADDSTTESAPDNVRQWLQLIRDENLLSSEDFLSATDSNSCPEDVSTMSQSTLHTHDEVDSVVMAECSKDLARELAVSARDKNVTSSSKDGSYIQFFSTNSVFYQKLNLGSCV